MPTQESIRSGQQSIAPQTVIDSLIFLNFKDGARTPELLISMLRDMTPNDLRRFLYLATAQCSIPAGGLQNPYPLATNPDKITIQSLGRSDSRRLPVGRACFYRVDMPEYEDRDLLREKLGATLGHLDGAGFDLD